MSFKSDFVHCSLCHTFMNIITVMTKAPRSLLKIIYICHDLIAYSTVKLLLFNCNVFLTLPYVFQTYSLV